ncbi:MAG: amidohydrolase family protein, partial [Mycobacterium sp.]|uniref:amidohydrolase family protein n=1 Tax=Mycobacterium sp. TaxID=1785 RepID=UPI003BAE6335
MGNLGYKAIDVDNHYYEPLDAFTRHLDKKFRRRGVQIFSDGKHTQAIIGDRVNRFVPNPTFDPIIEPGCLDLLFRGQIPEGVDPASLMKVERLEAHPEYQNRDARIAVMDTQGIETVFMLPTFACGVEEALKHDVEATMASLHAFNLWLDEDWGFDRPDHRIIAAPIISLADPDKALEEVEFVMGRGAKLILVRPAPVPGVVKPRSLGDPLHDPVWAALAEAGVPVGFHLSDSGYLQIAGMWGGRSTFEGFGGSEPLEQILTDDRAIHDTMASMIVHGVFTRHPKLKAVSIENGSYFVHRLIKRMKKAANSHPRLFPENPVEQLRNNVWIAPYYEDDLTELASAIGVEKI